nr:hypothetical protein CFP56_77566 [Quercus suber]
MKGRRREIPVWKRASTALLFHLMSRGYLSKCSKCSGGVLFVSSRRCIKSTSYTNIAEAHAMEFVRQNTSVPVPKVYSAFTFRGRVYIVMERLDGSNAANDWCSRSEESKKRILCQLKAMVEELRKIKVPVDVGVANIDHGPIFDHRLPHRFYWGPFKSIREFHRELLDGHDFTGVQEGDFPGLQNLVSFHNQPWPGPVFTHGDLSSLNVLCRGDDVVGIVDWETAGWLPPYWEYVMAWNVNPQNSFWQEEVGKFLEPWPVAQEMDVFRRKYFGLF